jgi:hypothetical protein
VRPRVLRAIALGWVLCLALLIAPLQLETRMVGLGGVILFAAMYVGERTTPRSRGGSRPSHAQRSGQPHLSFLAHEPGRR